MLHLACAHAPLRTSSVSSFSPSSSPLEDLASILHIGLLWQLGSGKDRGSLKVTHAEWESCLWLARLCLLAALLGLLLIWASHTDQTTKIVPAH